MFDTNVILHDYKCLFNFQDNDIFIPIVVLEELDKFKKGNDQINFNAREFVRELDEITDNHLFTEGALLGPDLGRLSIVVNSTYPEKVKSVFPEKKPEDYINDKVKNIDIFESEHRVLDNVSPEIIDAIYKSKDGIPATEISNDPFKSNECFVLESGTSSVLARYVSETDKVRKVIKEKNFGIEPRNAEQTFAFDLLNDPEVKLLALTGKAGTGKTLLALAGALRQNKLYKQILLARPIVALANKDLGYLPGDEKQKIAPYMQPLFDNLNVIKHQFSLESSDYRILQDMQEKGTLVIEALAYIRGRSLSETFCIIDEAQNLTPHEIKTIITRAGEGTKMVFTGDIQQIDSPYLDSQSNGLVYMIDKMQGQALFGHVNLIKGERSRLSELASNLL